MAIDQKIAVRGVLVLADARLDERRVFQMRKAAGEVLTHWRQPLGRHLPLAGLRIECRTVTVERDLEPAGLQIRDAVDLTAEVDPDGQQRRRESPVARRSAKKEYFLARRMNAVSEHVGKHFGEPRAARENEVVGIDRRAAARRDARQMALALGRCDSLRQIVRSDSQRFLYEGLYGPARQQGSALRFENAPRDGPERDLRVTLLQLRP